MKKIEDLAVALVNLGAIEKYSGERNSILIEMVREIREFLEKKFDIDAAELARLTDVLDNCADKDV